MVWPIRVTNNLALFLTSCIENQPIFETLITTLEHFTKDTSDLSTSKLSFTVLTKMILTWGGPDVVVQGQTTTPANPQPSLPGFDRFIVERFSPLCWTVAGSATINPRDAQAKNVLGEAAIMQQAIYAKTGQEYLNWLQNSSSSGINLSEIVNEEYLQALSTLDARKFRQYFQVSSKAL